MIADSINGGAAFLQDGAGRYVVGFGPFEERESPPPRGVAFYRNDFGLGDPRPWKVPRTVEVMDSLPADGTRETEVDWQDVGADGFAEIYAEVTEAIGRGLIEKSVPVVTETGVLQNGDPGGLLKGLKHLPENLRGYGWLGREEGFVGATPEHLLSVDKGLLKTMALAGTARSDDSLVFEADQKEIREHEYVAGSLAAKLSDIGTVRRAARRVMQLGPLVHFETPIEVDLNGPQEPDRLIRHLHPTPALGPLPRTDETLGLLLDWRNRLGCPNTFGAPFGVWNDGALTVVVAIRMIAWRGNEALLPSGCGVIAESRLVNEWRELRIKRDSVKTIFGV